MTLPPTRDDVLPCLHPALAGIDGHNTTPFDVLDHGYVPDKRVVRNALAAVKTICGSCPIMADCHTANRDERWVRTLYGRVNQTTVPPTTGTCAHCEETMIVPTRSITTKRFCSGRCSTAAHRAKKAAA